MSNIKWSEIDVNIRELVRLFNEAGFKTEFSCVGHNRHEPVYIVFDESVTQEQVEELILTSCMPYRYYGFFYYWVRRGTDGVMNPKIWKNWMFKIETPFVDSEDRIRQIKIAEDMVRNYISEKYS